MESDEIGHPRVLVLDSKQMWLDAALLAPKGAFFAYSFSCVISRNRDVFSTDILSEPLLRVFDSGSSDLDEPNPFPLPVKPAIQQAHAVVVIILYY